MQEEPPDELVCREGHGLLLIDELPQLLKVLKGEMSLVGPRPYLPEERSRIGDDLPSIRSAQPGITGLWQVSGRNQLIFEDRVTLEAWYVRNWIPLVGLYCFWTPQPPETQRSEVVSLEFTTKPSKSLHRSAGV